MPFDTKRINGPPVTQSLVTLLKKVQVKPLVVEDNRIDGRKCDEIRPIYLKSGIVQKANGSSYLETRGTKLVCSVYGPRDNPRKHEYSSTGTITVELSYAPFARTERLSVHADRQSKEYSGLIIEALHSAICLDSYPKAQIDVYINVLEDNGNTLSHAIVAASVALADAGIEMLDLVTSCSAVFNDKLMLTDPTNEEINHADVFGNITVAYLPSLNEISCLLKDGAQDVNDSISSINSCIESCLRIHSVMKECLVASERERR